MIEKKKKWKLADFDYPLPEKYIAQYPAKRRDLSKLMVIHKDTGEIRRKGYNKGMPLSSAVTSTLEGFNLISNILAVGVYLDEPRVTVYYMKSSDEEDYVVNVANVDIPYYGTTWENGIKIRTREYTR